MAARPGGVGVKSEADVAGEGFDLSYLGFGQGGAHGGDGVGAAVGVSADHIGVTLDDDDLFALADGGAGEIEAVEEGALFEDGGFGSVDVLGRFFDQSASAEAGAFAACVADGEHESVKEAVARALFGGDDEAGEFKVFGAVSAHGEVSGEGFAVAKGESEREALAAVAGDAAVVEVGAGVGAGDRIKELVAPEAEGGFVGGEQSGAGLFAGAPLFGLGLELDAGAFGELAQGFAEVDRLTLHDPAEDVSPF